MPTKSERQALTFFATIALLGAGAKLLTSDAPAVPTAHDRAALETQIAATDSAAEGEKKQRGRRKRLPRDRNPAPPEPPPPSVPRPAPPSGPASRDPRPAPPSGPLDVDLATQADLESLPFIGPSLAARIIADRETNGPFGSMQGLLRVRGIGPRLGERLANAVTFSGSMRPPTVPPAGAVMRAGEHPWAPGGNSSRPP